MVAYSAELTTGVDGCPAYRAWFQNHAKTWAQVCDKGGYARAFSGYAEAFEAAREAWEASNTKGHHA